MSDTVKYLLPESEMPHAWYNLAADLPAPPDPPRHPGTLAPLSAAALSGLPTV